MIDYIAERHHVTEYRKIYGLCKAKISSAPNAINNGVKLDGGVKYSNTPPHRMSEGINVHPSLNT